MNNLKHLLFVTLLCTTAIATPISFSAFSTYPNEINPIIIGEFFIIFIGFHILTVTLIYIFIKRFDKTRKKHFEKGFTQIILSGFPSITVMYYLGFFTERTWLIYIITLIVFLYFSRLTLSIINPETS